MEMVGTAAFRLAPQQQHVWLLQQRDGSQGYRHGCSLLIKGPVQADQLRAAVQQVITRHEILRTVFRRQPGIKLPFQVVLESHELAWHTADLSGLTADEQDKRLAGLRANQTSLAFDVESVPVAHVQLVALQPNQHLLTIVLPALNADAWTLSNLPAEIAACYSKVESKPDVTQYADVCEWQNELLESEEARAGRDYWREYCRAINVETLMQARLPFEVSPPGEFSPQNLSVELPEDFGRAAATCSRLGIPLRILLLGCWSAVLARLTGQQQLVLGCLYDGRRYEELQRCFGPLAKALPIAARVDGAQPLKAFLADLNDAWEEAHKWQECFTWEQLHTESKAGVAYLPFGFEYEERPQAIAVAGVRFSLGEQFGCAQPFKIKLACVIEDAALKLQLQYNGALYERTEAERVAGYLRQTLRQAVRNSDLRLGDFELLGESQRQQMLEAWNQTQSVFGYASTLQRRFEEQVARTPSHIAVVCGARQLTYHHLNVQANQLAHWLRRQGVGPEVPVGVCLDRSVELMVAVIAVAKAGGVFVPLNADNPKARLQQQLVGTKVLLTEAKLEKRMPEFAGVTAVTDRDHKRWENEETANPEVLAAAENLVYVIYTSGSTGVPKGVGLTHRNLMNYVEYMVQRLELRKHPDGLKFATVSTISADLGNTCIYPSLLSGGTLHLVEYDVATDSRLLAGYIREHHIDVLKIVPSHLSAVLEGPEGTGVLPRRYLITGGEALSFRLAEKILSSGASCKLINHYGPTETTVGSLTLDVTNSLLVSLQGRSATIPIGRPLANTRVYVLDQARHPVPVGVAGELYIAGAGVARGYVNQAEMTAERFVKDPFSPQPQARMYRTGDLVRWLPEGMVEFLGRGDDQVKVRGFRIELGEVEAALATCAGVKQSVVVARDEAGEKRLVGYVVARERTLKAEDLRRALKERLPEYMIPSALVFLDRIPLNPNGKVDRQALPAPDAQQRAYIAPRTLVEGQVTQIWQELLALEQVSVKDNFFDLGGHSLLAVRMLNKVEAACGKRVPLALLYTSATVEGISAAIETQELQEANKDILIELQAGGSKSPLFCVVGPGQRVNALGYLALARHLGPEQPVYKLQSPDREGKEGPYNQAECEAEAGRYIRSMKVVQPRGPYFLAGMCLGAPIALEMARTLQVEGEQIALLAVLDTWNTENTYNKLWWVDYFVRRARRQFQLSLSDQVKWVAGASARLSRTIALKVAAKLGLERGAPAPHAWRTFYWPEKGSTDYRFDGNIILFKVSRQPYYCVRDPELGWGKRCRRVELHVIPGSHTTVLREPHVRVLAENLATSLNTAQASFSSPIPGQVHAVPEMATAMAAEVSGT